MPHRHAHAVQLLFLLSCYPSLGSLGSCCHRTSQTGSLRSLAFALWPNLHCALLAGPSFAVSRNSLRWQRHLYALRTQESREGCSIVSGHHLLFLKPLIINAYRSLVKPIRTQISGHPLAQLLRRDLSPVVQNHSRSPCGERQGLTHAVSRLHAEARIEGQGN